MAQTYTITHMGAGLHTEADPAQIDPSACTSCRNVVFDRKTLRKRPGRVRHSGYTAATTAGARAIFEQHVPGNTPATFHITAQGTKLYRSTTSAQGTYTALQTAVPADAAIHATNAIFAQQHGEDLYVVDGKNYVKKITKAGVVSDLVDLFSPATAPELTVNVIPSVMGDTHAGSAAGYYTENGGSDSLPTNTDFGPAAVAWGTATGGDVAVKAAQARLVDDSSILYGDSTATVCLEILPDSTSVFSTQISGIYKMQADLGATNDFSDTARLSVRVYTHALIYGYYSYSIQVAPAGSAPATEGDWTTIPLSTPGGISLSTQQEWSADLTPTQITALEDVQYVAFKAQLTHAGTAARIDIDAGDQYPTIPNAVQLFVDGIRLISDVPTFATGTYEFTYTYGYTVDGQTVQSAPQRASAAPVYANVLVEDGQVYQVGVAPTMTAMPTGVSAYDRVHIYARGGTSYAFREITPDGGYTIAPSGTYTLTWDGIYRAESAFLDEYIGTPPAWCTLIGMYRGRVCYAGPRPGATIDPTTGAPADCWHLANTGDPTRVPQQETELLEAPATYGGAQPIGTPGDIITAMGNIGQAYALFKANSIFLGVGDPGQVTFAVNEAVQGMGTISPRTMQSYENIVYWLDTSKGIYAWNGSEPVFVGEPVYTLTKAMTATQQTTSFAYLDHANKRYVLTVPSAVTATATPAATSYALDLDTGAWTVFDAQPGGAALWSQHAATPGVYATDLYNTGTAGQIYRLSDATTDATSVTGATAVAIGWEWISKAFRAQQDGHYLGVNAVQVQTAAGSGLTTVTLGLRENANSSDSATATITVAASPGQPGTATWYPPRLADMAQVQLRIAGSTSTADEITSATMTVTERGRIR